MLFSPPCFTSALGCAWLTGPNHSERGSAARKWDSHLKGDGERCHGGDAEGQGLIDFLKWTQNCVCVKQTRVFFPFPFW